MALQGLGFKGGLAYLVVMDEKPKQSEAEKPQPIPAQPAGEVGGPKGPEPTRYGDWEQKGRCSDF